jgi:hypothetical protein
MIPRGGVGVYVGYIVHHFVFRITREGIGETPTPPLVIIKRK